MIYLKWLFLALLDWVLYLTIPFAVPVVAAIYGAMPYGLAPYTWGWIWGTWDNPPQGDEGYVRQRAPFIGYSTGWRGYINRCRWMIRNPLYGYALMASLEWTSDMVLSHIGDPDISDKERRPGWYYASLRRSGRLVGFEFYAVLPWLPNGLTLRLWRWEFYLRPRDMRIRLGWKLMTDKVQRYGFAQLVNSINPLDGYGDSTKGHQVLQE